MIGNLTLDQLRVLVTIADAGSFSAASRKLCRVQSAVSQTVATLEDMQGVTLFDRSGRRPSLTATGRVLVDHARAVLASAARFEAVAAGVRENVEPELTVAIDPLVPNDAFIDSLHAARTAFPHLPVNFSTEGLGGAERRLRRGYAALAFCVLDPKVPEDLVALPLTTIALIPVVARDHPLAKLGRLVTRPDLEEHIQLVLSDPSAPEGPNYGVLSSRIWRFAELSRRLDFLLAGFGWCRMPEHVVAPLLVEGRLVRLRIRDDPTPASKPLTIYAARLRDQLLGRAGAWLLQDLGDRFRSWGASDVRHGSE